MKTEREREVHTVLVSFDGVIASYGNEYVDSWHHDLTSTYMIQSRHNGIDEKRDQESIYIYLIGSVRCLVSFENDHSEPCLITALLITITLYCAVSQPL